MWWHKNRLHLERRHWLWHLSLPSVGSLGLLIAAPGLWRHWPPALTVSALAVLLLVITGVINAWEIALQIVKSVPADLADDPDSLPPSG